MPEDQVIPFFNFGEEVCRLIYTTNAIESDSSVIRKASTWHKMFPNDEAALKAVYSAIEVVSKNGQR